MKKPKLIIVTGQPGSGKTTLAKKLGEELYLPLIGRDQLKEGFVNTFGVKHTKLPEDSNAKVTKLFFKTLKLLVSNQISVIGEAAFQHKVWKPKLLALSKKAEISIVICKVDPILAAKRHLKRGLKDKKRTYFHQDDRVVHYKKTGEFLYPSEYVPPDLPFPTIQVNTTKGYKPGLTTLAKKLV